MKNMDILEIKNLSVEYYRNKKVIPAVQDVSLQIKDGESIALVGESGCGKTTLALSILKLIDSNEGKITNGEIIFSFDSVKTDLLKLTGEDLRKIRGNHISMIFQDPFTSLNPVFTVGEQIKEALLAHTLKSDWTEEKLKEKVLSLLSQVKMSNPERVFNAYPHQLSGGMQQRVMIAIAVSFNPKILIADEPTTALDVHIQKEILDLIALLKTELKMSVILITHNLAIVSQNVNKVAVMYAGRIVEEGYLPEIFSSPAHPYTKLLIETLPKIGQQQKRLTTIPGQIPDVSNLPVGCKFNPRCPDVFEKCLKEEPVLSSLADLNNRKVSCFKY